MKHIRNSVGILLCFMSLSAIAQENHKDLGTKINGNFVHTVLFWLNHPENEKDQETFENGVNTLLDQCQFITASHIGVPADTATRPVVDASYTYCVVITFESKAAHDSYQIDPVHKKFVEENKNLWKKVLVYDSVSP